MHALDWLNELGRVLRGAIQPIAGVHFYRSRFRYRGLCDRALSMGPQLKCCRVNKGIHIVYTADATTMTEFFIHHDGV